MNKNHSAGEQSSVEWCGRCGGLMVGESTYVKEAGISAESQETRCLNCGNVEDAVIWNNRLVQRPAKGTERHSVGDDITHNW